MIPSFCQKGDKSIISTGSICNHLRMLPIFSFFCVVKHHRWYRSAANRAYYAIFHAMRAVLALDGVDMKHHSGIISEFRKRYIKTGVFDASLSGLISGASQKPKSGAVRKYPCIFKKVLLFLWLQMPLQAYQSNLVLGLCCT